MNKTHYVLVAFCFLFGSVFSSVFADTLILKDGTVLSNCYVRDEGVQFSLWRTFEKVGEIPELLPASAVKSYNLDRSDSRWDKHPELSDLSVTFIEMNPKLPSLHGNVDYNELGMPIVKSTPKGFKSIGERAAMHPEEVVADVKFQYDPGQLITLTAHVRNIGFTSAKPFDYTWKMDGKIIKKGTYSSDLSEMQEALFPYQFAWKPGFHEVSFEISTDQKEIAVNNNAIIDPLWGYSYTFYADNGRIAAWHQVRNAGGTFSFEDYYRFHIDMMNNLFKNSVFPASPSGIIARVRLDRVVYTDDIKQYEERFSSDGLLHEQGAWKWVDTQDDTRKYEPPNKESRNSTEWSLPHELGHQLGSVDWYTFDCAGSTNHVMADTGENATHFMRHPANMMHSHGPQPFSEVDAGYFNMTLGKPRGYYADYIFAVPLSNYIHLIDVNGYPVKNAKIEVFQRGVSIDKKKKPVSANGTTWYPILETGEFGYNIDKDPVITGSTDNNGTMLLPNRDVDEVKTLNGFYRRPNPLGNMNVVGQRGILLIKVTAFDRPLYYFLENYDFNTAWFRGNSNSCTFVFKTPYGSSGGPLSPVDVAAKKDGTTATVTWSEPPAKNERNYLEKVIGYTVYRRISNDGLNDKPWFPVATVGPETFSVSVDLEQYPQDNYWFSRVERFAVSSQGESGKQSELVETLLK